MALLGEVIRKATGLRIDHFAEQYLFTPLGITEYEWIYINHNIIQASGSSYLRPRDMAKFGYLYLNDGVWNGERVISKKWIEDSIKAYLSVSPDWWANEYGDRYGYQWWLRTDYSNSTPYHSYLRTGWGGQRISVYPNLDMVVVLTGGNYAMPEPVNEIITKYILPAVR